MTGIPNPVFGADAITLRTTVGPAWVVDAFTKIPEALRQQAFATRCRDFRYYEVTEAGLPDQFEYRYFVFQEESSGNWAVQPLFFVHQDLLAGLPTSLRSLFNGIRKIWPGFLKLRMLMIGCATNEGELDRDEPWIAQALLDAVEA